MTAINTSMKCQAHSATTASPPHTHHSCLHSTFACVAPLSDVKWAMLRRAQSRRSVSRPRCAYASPRSDSQPNSWFTCTFSAVGQIKVQFGSMQQHMVIANTKHDASYLARQFQPVHTLLCCALTTL